MRGLWGGGGELVVRLGQCAVPWSQGVRRRYTHSHTHTLTPSQTHTNAQTCTCAGTVESLQGSRSEGPSILAYPGFTLPGSESLTSIEGTTLKKTALPLSVLLKGSVGGVAPGKMHFITTLDGNGAGFVSVCKDIFMYKACAHTAL